MNEVLARETTKNQLQPSTQHREVVFEDVLMNTQRPSPLNPELSQTPKSSRRFFWPRQLGGVLGLSWILLAMGTAQAATTLAWDPNASGASDGSGTWHGGNTWWNGTADQAWVDGSIVFIGTNTAGNYSLVLDSPASATTVAFRTNNYTLSGSTLTWTGMTLTNGVSVTINCGLSTPGGTVTLGNGGSTLTLAGGCASTTGNPNFRGSSAAASTLNLTGGNYTGAGTFQCDAITINQSGGAFAFGSWIMGRNLAGPAIWNLSGGTFRNTAVNGFSISRGKTALFNVSGSGLLGSLGTLAISGASTTDDGTLNVLGGTANIGTSIAGTPGVSSSSLANVTLFGGAFVYTAAAKSALNISGGTVTAKGISFGNAGASYVNHPVSQVNLSGGMLYLDAYGIAITNGVTGFNTPVINLSGGTIAATTNWTGSLPMTLNTTNGNLTVQAADVNGTPWNITWSGGLSGTGGLIKTGGGTLILSGTNYYSGTTTVSSGRLTVSTAGATSIGPVSASSGATLSTVLAAAGSTWTNAGLVLANSGTADFNFGSFQPSPSTPALQVNGDLTLDSSDNFTIEGSAILIGTYPLITWSGTLVLTGGASLPAITSLTSGITASLVQSGNTINLVVSSIIAQPQSVTTNYAATATFTATGQMISPPLTYAWYKGSAPLINGLQADGSIVSGAQGSSSGSSFTTTLTLANVSYLEDGGYTLFVTNNANNFVSTTPATLTVIDPYIVTQPPFEVVVPLGGANTIHVVAAGSGLTYQWYSASLGQLNNGGDFSGVTTPTLTISGAQTADASIYYVVVTGSNGSVQSANVSVYVENTQLGPFSPSDWPASISPSSLVDYCILDPNANFTPPPGWNNVMSLAGGGDQTYTGVTYSGLYGDEGTAVYFNFVDPNWKNFVNVPVIDILVQVYGNSAIYNADSTGLSLTFQEGEVGTLNYEHNVRSIVPQGANNGQWNWMLFSVTNPIDPATGFRYVGDTSYPTQGAGTYGGLNNGTIRCFGGSGSVNGITIRAVAFGPQGAFGSTNQINRFATTTNCPLEPNANLAYVDFNSGVTNNLTVLTSDNLGEPLGYNLQSGVGPTGDLRTAIQSSSYLMNFAMLGNYLGQSCNPALTMQLCIEFYDDPNMAGSSFGPYQ
jgi:autotransporter-associated beta strand protein